MSEQCQKTECQNNDPQQPEIAPAPSTIKQSLMPSVEKRRRRLQQASEDRRRIMNQGERDIFNERWIGNSTIAAALLTLFLLSLLQKDKIIKDIRHTKSSSTPKRLVRLSIVMATHVILSPISYMKAIVYQLFHITLRGIINPLRLPGELWELILFVLEDGRFVGRRLYCNLFGGQRSKARRKVKGNETLPELQNEDDSVHCDEKRIPLQALDRKAPIKRIQYNSDKLPSAFLKDDEYPPGWLVYHPEYGVITLEKILELMTVDSNSSTKVGGRSNFDSNPSVAKITLTDDNGT